MRLGWTALLVAACDAAAPPNYNPTLLTIHGRITTSAIETTPQVRVALVWLSVQPGQGAFQYAQDVGVQSQFPAGFLIDVTTLPPDATIDKFFPEQRQSVMQQGMDPDMQWAQGALLVYEDGNGNGTLDVAPPGQVSPDRVVGTAQGVTVWFLAQGRPAPERFRGRFPIGPGFTITRDPTLHDPAPGDCSTQDDMGIYDWPCTQDYNTDGADIPTDQPIDIALSGDPALAGYSCQTFWSLADWPDWASDWNASSPLASQICRGDGCDCRGYGCPLDLPPAGTQVSCNADGTAYVWKACVADAALCGTRFCHYGHGERAAGAPPPADWPCR
jgi:hypothetical protein